MSMSGFVVTGDDNDKDKYPARSIVQASLSEVPEGSHMTDHQAGNSVKFQNVKRKFYISCEIFSPAKFLIDEILQKFSFWQKSGKKSTHLLMQCFQSPETGIHTH